ncbi:hypothetical protein RVV18_004597 [Burkholderia ambifaria]|nr:hypothetical protein [Burkholderia ambifaria]
MPDTHGGRSLPPPASAHSALHNFAIQRRFHAQTAKKYRKSGVKLVEPRARSTYIAFHATGRDAERPGQRHMGMETPG